MEPTEERRKEVFRCIDSPCKPVLDELEKKMSSKIAMWIISGLCFFTVVIIGGSQFTLLERISKISADTQVVREVQKRQDLRLTKIEDGLWKGHK